MPDGAVGLGEAGRQLRWEKDQIHLMVEMIPEQATCAALRDLIEKLVVHRGWMVLRDPGFS